MATLKIENALGMMPSTLTGEVNYFELPDPPVPPFPGVITNPNPPSIQMDQPWQVVFTWQAEGIFFQFFGDSVHWHGDLLMEQYGPGEPGMALPTFTVNGIAAFTHNYTGTLNIPAGLVPQGVYRLVARLSMNPDSSPKKIAAGFVELGIVEFYAG